MHRQRSEQPPYLRRAEALRSFWKSDSARLGPGSQERDEQSSLLTGLRSQRCCSGSTASPTWWCWVGCTAPWGSPRGRTAGWEDARRDIRQARAWAKPSCSADISMGGAGVGGAPTRHQPGRKNQQLYLPLPCGNHQTHKHSFRVYRQTWKGEVWEELGKERGSQGCPRVCLPSGPVTAQCPPRKNWPGRCYSSGKEFTPVIS